MPNASYRTLLIPALGLTLLASGCASIVTGTEQRLSVETLAAGEKVSGAHCKLENDKGTWHVTSPGSTTVHRSYQNLNVLCEQDGRASGVTSAKSVTKGIAFGNIIFGGIIGAAVDIGTGAAYDYPSIISVELGKAKQIDPPAPSVTQAAADGAKTAVPD